MKLLQLDLSAYSSVLNAGNFTPKDLSVIKYTPNGGVTRNLMNKSDEVIPHEKFRIYVAPIKANYAFDFYSPINLETKQVLDGWKAVAENQIIMYLYDLNYRIYFVNFNNFSSFAGMLKACQEIGTTYLTTQGVSDTYICCFDEMRTYVETSLMWDVNRSYEELLMSMILHISLMKLNISIVMILVR